MVTPFRKCLLGIFTFYMLVFSLIRMDYVAYSDLSYFAKFLFLLIILIIEFGIIYYFSGAWEFKNLIYDASDMEEIKASKKTLALSMVYSGICVVALVFDFLFAQSYYSGLFYNFVIISDLICLVVLLLSIVNFYATGLLIRRITNGR